MCAKGEAQERALVSSCSSSHTSPCLPPAPAESAVSLHDRAPGRGGLHSNPPEHRLDGPLGQMALCQQKEQAADILDSPPA